MGWVCAVERQAVCGGRGEADDSDKERGCVKDRLTTGSRERMNFSDREKGAQTPRWMERRIERSGGQQGIGSAGDGAYDDPVPVSAIIERI